METKPSTKSACPKWTRIIEGKGPALLPKIYIDTWKLLGKPYNGIIIVSTRKLTSTFEKSSGLASQLLNCIGNKKYGDPLGSSWHLGNIPGIPWIKSSEKRKCVSRINYPCKLRLHGPRISWMSSQRQIGNSWKVKMVRWTKTLWSQDNS